MLIVLFLFVKVTKKGQLNRLIRKVSYLEFSTGSLLIDYL
jgi:hypothetical protein